MTEKPNNQNLERRIALLEKKVEEQERFKKINEVLYKISNAVNTTRSLDELFKSIHLALSPIVDTTNFYISLYDKDKDSLTFPYIVDSVDVCYPPVIGVSNTASSTAFVIQTEKPALMKKADILSLRKMGLVTPQCTPSEVWLGVPLKTRDEIIGVMAVQNYQDALCYDETHVNLLVSVADQVATALERKKAEKALRDSEEKFRHIITTVREGIVSMDAHWRITFANAHFAEMFGYELDELIGQSFEILFHDDDLDDFANQKNERQKGKYSQFERKFKTKDGRTIWTIVSATALIDNEGSFAGSFGTITDISERKEAEKALQEKMQELRQAFDQIKTLRGILPICMHCKKIRDDQGYWNQVEIYVRNHTEADFSHGICPDCLKILYPEYE